MTAWQELEFLRAENAAQKVRLDNAQRLLEGFLHEYGNVASLAERRRRADSFLASLRTNSANEKNLSHA